MSEAEQQTFKRFLDRTVQDALQPGAIGVSLLYIVFTVGHYFWLPPQTARPLMIVSAGTSTALAALYVALRRRSVAAAWSHALAAGIAALVLSNSFLTLHLLAEPRQTTNFMLLAIGVGWFFTSTQWLVLFLAVSVGAWFFAALQVALTPEWVHFGFALISSAGLALMMHAVHRRTLKRVYELKELEREKIRLETEMVERARGEEERRELEALMHHSQKLESLGALAGGIAHDFNNLLTGILSNTGLALKQSPLGSPARVHLQRIDSAVNRAARITRQLLAYTGRGQSEKTWVDPSQAIEEIAHLLVAVVSQKALLSYRFSPNLPQIWADPSQLQQVVLQLIMNASEALTDDGLITVMTGSTEVKAASLDRSYLKEELADGRYVFVEVSDTGPGIGAEALSKIFDPFYTTKEQGRGLGLASVLGIVRGHRGAVKVDSRAGQGTTIRILFPCSNQLAKLG